MVEKKTLAILRSLCYHFDNFAQCSRCSQCLFVNFNKFLHQISGCLGSGQTCRINSPSIYRCHWGKVPTVTHIHNIIGCYNHTASIMALLLAPLMLCILILYGSSAAQSLKSTPNNRFLRDFAWQFYSVPEFMPEICWEKVIEGIFLFVVSVWSRVWNFTSCIISQHNTY